MLTTFNDGKYLTRSYEREKNYGEWDSSNLTTDDITFYEIQDGEGELKFKYEQLRRKTDGILYSY